MGMAYNNLAEVFHEIKNPLSTIKINVEILKDNINEISFEHGFSVIENEILRIENVLNKYITFDKDQKLEKEKIYFFDVIKNISAQNKITYPDVSVRVYDPQEVSILAYEYHIFMVFSNIIKNAIEAMKSVGNIDIFIKEVEGLAIIEIFDEGIGLKPHEIENIKKGNYTSKINGSGLGTAIIYNIVNIYNGTFYLANRENTNGAIAVLQLPVM